MSFSCGNEVPAAEDVEPFVGIAVMLPEDCVGAAHDEQMSTARKMEIARIRFRVIIAVSPPLFMISVRLVMQSIIEEVNMIKRPED